MPEMINRRTVFHATPILTATGGAQNVDTVMDRGVYYIGIAVNAAVTGTTTTVAITPLDESGTVTAAALVLAEPDDIVGVPALILPAGATSHVANALFAPFAVALTGPTLIPGGLRVTIVNGTATSGQKLEVTIYAVRAG